MSRRGKELAAEGARRMLELSGVTKAHGTIQFDQMAKACRDQGETLAIVEKAATLVLAEKQQVARERLTVAAQLDQISAMTRQVGVYLDRIESIYLTPVSPVRRPDRILDDFVIGSRPVTKPEVNGHSPEGNM